MDQVSNVAEASVEEEQDDQTNEETSGDCDTDAMLNENLVMQVC